MRCGSKVGLWHFGSGPWPWTHAPVSAAWRRIIKGGSSCAEIPAYLAHGYRCWWRDLLCCEWAWLLLDMYLGTSGRRGIEYLWPAKKRSMTRTDWGKRGRYTEPSYLGASAAGRRGGRRGEEATGRQEEQQSRRNYVPGVLCPVSRVLCPAPCTFETYHRDRIWYNPIVHISTINCCTLTSCKSKHGQSINHQQSIFSPRHTAGPDRATRLLSRAVLIDTCLPVSVNPSQPMSLVSPLHKQNLLHCGRIRSCPSQTSRNPIHTPSELLCQPELLSPKSDPIGLATMWSSLLVSSDGQQLSHMPSARKAYPQSPQVVYHAQTFVDLPDLLSSVPEGAQT